MAVATLYLALLVMDYVWQRAVEHFSSSASPPVVSSPAEGER